DYAWRLNYIVLTGLSCIFLGSLFALPESPRWLIERGREDEARAILEKLHRNPADPSDNSLAKGEFVQIRAQISAERSLPSSYWYILTTPSMLKRAVCTLLVWTMGQSTGITVIANLIATLMGNLGFDTVMQLGLGVAWDACVLVGCFINVVLMDRLGRVNLLVIGGLGSVVLLIIEGVLQKYYLDTTYTAGLNAAVAMYFIFGVWFTSTIECTGYVYGAEIWPTHLRSKGATLNYIGFFGPALAYTYPATTAFTTIGWKYYMVFVAITVPCCVAIYFLLPETTGLTLEEIGPLFGDDVQVKFEDALHADLGDSSTTQSVSVHADEKDS
ncbi:MFS sugar transporter, partial [Lasiodiplodia theobromae]|uniref:MFS sugar transporter n=1 Tax=Lasiodiplodia theobromae TaxID=45133 RepID=UPI0015C310D7